VQLQIADLGLQIAAGALRRDRHKNASLMASSGFTLAKNKRSTMEQIACPPLASLFCSFVPLLFVQRKRA
jgi:hypothetical protein